MRLSLINPIHYRVSDKSIDDVISGLSSFGRGFDYFAKYRLSLSADSMELVREECGERLYTHEELRRIEEGLLIEPKEEETLSIPAGSYEFIQRELLDEKALKAALLPYASADRTIYVRIFKESAIECVMQLLILALS